MDIEHVRSRFIKHFDGTTGAVYALVNTPTITVDLYSPEPLTKV